MRFLVYVAAAVAIAACSAPGPPVIRQNTGATLMTGWYHVVDSSAFKRKDEYDTSWYYIDPSPIVTAENIKDMQVFEYDAGGFGLGMRLDDNVVAIWEDATKKASMDRKQFAFILNDRLLCTPTVQGPIYNGNTAVSFTNSTRGQLEKIMQEILKEIPKSK